MSAPKAKKVTLLVILKIICDFYNEISCIFVGRVLSDDIKTKVLEFYESDDVSVNLMAKDNTFKKDLFCVI